MVDTAGVVTGVSGRVSIGSLRVQAEFGHQPVERRSVEQSLANLTTFPWIRSRVADGRLELIGAWFDIALGELHALGAGGWRPIEEA